MKKTSSIEEFLKDPVYGAPSLSNICSAETLLAEALNNDIFVHAVVFYKATNWRYYNPAGKVINAILKFFPEKLLEMQDNYFLKFACSIGDGVILAPAVLHKMVNRMATVSCDKTTIPDIDIVINESFFNNCIVGDKCRIIKNLVSYDIKIELTLDNLDELFKHHASFIDKAGSRKSTPESVVRPEG